MEENPELQRKLRLRYNLPTETNVVHYPYAQNEEEDENDAPNDDQNEEQNSPLNLKIKKSSIELDSGTISPRQGEFADLSQMLPVNTIIEVINEETDDFLVYSGIFFIIYRILFLIMTVDTGHTESCVKPSPESSSESSSSSSPPPPRTLAVSFLIFLLNSFTTTLFTS